MVENAGSLISTMEQSEALNALLQTQADLQAAVGELCRKFEREAKPPRAPSDVLTKLTPEDDVEAYIEVFECTATREDWPVADWASILAPFLSGEAQRACRDLPVADARDFVKLKAAILARHGYSLPARAQRFHSWNYDPAQPPRPQVATLARFTQSWLSGNGPPWIERIVMDRCIRALPPDARKYAAQVSPGRLDELVALLENYQVSMEMMKLCKSEQTRHPADRRRAVPGHPRTPAPPTRTPPQRRCYICGLEDHLSSGAELQGWLGEQLTPPKSDWLPQLPPQMIDGTAKTVADLKSLTAMFLLYSRWRNARPASRGGATGVARGAIDPPEI